MNTHSNPPLVGKPGRNRLHPLRQHGHFAFLFSLLVVIASGAFTASAAPALELSHDTYLAGEDIVVKFSGGPGNKLDWIGVYPAEIVPDGNPGSTIWFYVDGTRGGATGFSEGTVTFPAGLNLAGDWVAFFLLNDGYTQLASIPFKVVDPGSPVVRLNKRTYAQGEAIEVSFTSAPGNPKDRIGIYKLGETPGGPAATLISYLDGSGTTGVTEGAVNFPGGIAAAGEYVAHLLLDDGFDILASESFKVVASTTQKPRVVSISPTDGETGFPPVLNFVAKIANGDTHVVAGSVKLELDDSVVAHQFNLDGETITISYHHTPLLAALSSHHYKLTFADDAAVPGAFTVEGTFTIASYVDIQLPAPIAGTFENFDSVPEGQLPAGWTEKGYSSPINAEVDFTDLGSTAYQTWTVVNADRFTGTFKTYGNPDSDSADYQRVLIPNPVNVVNGQALTGPLATGRFLFGNSGYQNSGASQVLFATTPDYNLTGKSDIYVSFHSLWEQNQDSIGTCEYSIDGGQNWLPIFYLLEVSDIIKDDQGAVDVDATLNTDYGDVAHYTDDNGDDQGGHYGAFVGAPITPALAPYIQGRIDNNPVESKRVEFHRLTQADNQATVRLRFIQAGTDSWYWGLDDFGLYSIPGVVPIPPTLSVTRSGNDIVVSWPTDAVGWTLEGSDKIAGGIWNPVPGVAGNSATIPTTGDRLFVRLVHP